MEQFNCRSKNIHSNVGNNFYFSKEKFKLILVSKFFFFFSVVHFNDDPALMIYAKCGGSHLHLIPFKLAVPHSSQHAKLECFEAVHLDIIPNVLFIKRRERTKQHPGRPK